MREALSMYLGGDLISATECDYNTSKEFGLVCPCCHEPVYYCAGSVHEKTEKKKLTKQNHIFPIMEAMSTLMILSVKIESCLILQ